MKSIYGLDSDKKLSQSDIEYMIWKGEIGPGKLLADIIKKENETKSATNEDLKQIEEEYMRGDFQ